MLPPARLKRARASTRFPEVALDCLIGTIVRPESKSSQVKSSHFKSINSQKSGRRDIDIGIRLLLFLYTRINRVIT